MTAYYNEHDPFAAAWLRELIKQGHIAPGVVDERSIEDIRPSDLEGYTQCHFFAGIGVWSYALRRAGWPDDKPVWTGSCPCQPFSAAGKGAGFADERHLWPAWFHLITTAKPDAVPVLGEQVASKDGLVWLDLVQADMEAAGYAFGAVDLCAAGVGAPHIRQRLFFVAERAGNPTGARYLGSVEGAKGDSRNETRVRRPSAGCDTGGVADANSGEQPRVTELRGIECDGANPRWAEGGGSTPACSDTGGMADADGRDPCPGWEQSGREYGQQSKNSGDVRSGLQGPRAETRPELAGPGPTNGLWADADWLYCRDGKWRPVESGTFPLVNGAPARVGRLRGYGNAINAEVAAAFIEAAGSCLTNC